MDSSVSTHTAPEIIKLMGHDLRWQLLKALAWGDLRVNELVHLTGQPQNLISYHLKKLRDYALVTERRSSADNRALYYSLDIEAMRFLFMQSAKALHPAISCMQEISDPLQGTGKTSRVLFLCTHNSARSQMAEGLLRKRSKGQFSVFSAGTEPTAVHPLAIQALDELGVDIRQQRSKSMDEYLSQSFDYTITVCDRAREACPVFPGDPVQLHWSFPDPLAVQGSEAVQLEAFRKIAGQLDKRIENFLLAVSSSF